MKFFKAMFAVIAIALFVSSCAKKPEDLAHIPENVNFLITLNPQQIKEKSGVDNFASTNIYKQIVSEDSSEIDEELMSQIHEYDYIFEDETQSGVDFEKQLFIFKMSNANGYYTSKAVSFGIDDEVKFEALLKKATKEQGDSILFAEQDGVKYLLSTKVDNMGIIAWNKETAVIFGLGDNYRDNSSLLARAVELVNQKKGESIANNQSFVDFYEKKKDISVWVNSDFIMSQIPKNYKSAVTMQMPFNIKGIEYRYYVSFEKGAAEVETELVLPEQLRGFMDEYKIIKPNFDKDILSHIPGNSLFNFSLAIDALELYRMVKDLYKERQMSVDGMESFLGATLGIDIEKIFEAINGEFVFNVHDVSINKSDALDSNTYNEESVNVKMSMLVKLDNDELYKLFLRQFNKGNSEMNGGYYSIPSEGQIIHVVMDSNIMMITNDEPVMKSFVAHEPVKPSLKDGDIAKALNNYAFYGKANLDYSSYGDDVQKYYIDKYHDLDKANIRHKIKEIRLVPKDSYSNKLIIELKDKDRNSLKVLFNN